MQNVGGTPLSVGLGQVETSCEPASSDQLRLCIYVWKGWELDRFSRSTMSFTARTSLILFYALCIGIYCVSCRLNLNAEIVNLDAPESNDVSQPHDYRYTFDAGSDLLPEVDSYMAAVQAMTYQALLIRQPSVPPGHYTYRGVRANYGGEPVQNNIVQPLLLYGLDATVFQSARSRRFLTGVYHLLEHDNQLGRVFFEEASGSASVSQPLEECTTPKQLDDILESGAIVAPLNVEKRQTEDDMMPPANNGAKTKLPPRPVMFCYRQFGDVVKPGHYYPLLSGSIRHLASRNLDWPVTDTMNKFGDVQISIRQLSSRSAPPAYLVWEDAIHMLFYAAMVAAGKGKWQYINIQTKYIVGSGSIIIGDLTIEKRAPGFSSECQRHSSISLDPQCHFSIADGIRSDSRYSTGSSSRAHLVR